MTRAPRRAKAATLPPYLKEAVSEALKAMLAAGGYPIQAKLIQGAVARLARDIANGLPEMEQAWRRTGNPFFALDAWGLCRRARVPIPLWVEVWIEEALLALMNVDARDVGQIAKALGFRPGRGARSADTQYHQYLADRAIARQVRAELNKLGGSKQQAAIHAVAQRLGKSPSGVDAATRRANRIFPPPRRR
jgi:hypothetical protein